MNVTAITFEAPHLLWLLVAVAPAVVLLQLATRAGAGRFGRVLSSVIRAAALAIGVTALAAPKIPSRVGAIERPQVVILRDCSDSVAGDTRIHDFSENISSALGGKASITELSFACGLLPINHSTVGTDDTDIERALDEAAQRLPSLDRADVILLSDGRSTRGSATNGAARLAMRGLRVHVIPVGQQRDHPPRILESEPPTDARLGIASSMRVTVGADETTPCSVTLVDAEGHDVDSRQLTVEAHARSTMLLRFIPKEPGVLRYAVRISSLGEPSATKTIPIVVEGPPRILVADSFPSEAAALTRALSTLRMPVDLVDPDQWPDELTPYAAVVISDFSGNELSLDQRVALQRYVETTGGGLVFVGGSNVVAKRWEQNTLARALPMRLRPRPAKVLKKDADVAVCFVLDRSGSMHEVLPGSAGGVSKLEMVKAAVMASLQSLPDTAQIAVICFDTQAQVVVPPTAVTERESIGKMVDTIGVGGGTAMYPGVRKGLELLNGMRGSKHLILLTDGDTPGPDDGSSWESVADAAVNQGVSWTSVAVGADADQTLLRMLANRASGQYAFCDTGDQIPQVFVDEAKVIKRLSEPAQKPFIPQAGPDLADLRDLASAKFPELEGAVPAERREGAHVQLLGSGGHDVLLSDWQFGAGRVVAFCSSAKPTWAGNWLNWPDFSRFWTHIVSSVARIRQPLRATVRSSHAGSHVQFTFDVRDEDGQPARDLNCTSDLSPALPAGSPVQWRELQPGTYRAELDLPRDGKTYEVSMDLTRDDHRAVHYHAALSAEDGGELAATGPDLQQCEEIAMAGDGTCSPDPATAIEAILSRPQPKPTLLLQPLWPFLLLMLMLLLPLDVWVRKLF